jgi:hypothetical protein
MLNTEKMKVYTFTSLSSLDDKITDANTIPLNAIGLVKVTFANLAEMEAEDDWDDDANEDAGKVIDESFCFEAGYDKMELFASQQCLICSVD